MMSRIIYERTRLSAREFEIAEKLVFNGTKKETSQTLGITVRTVETQVKRIYEKLGITKLNELVLWYCAVAFDIAKDIEKKKVEVGIAVMLSLTVLISTTFEHNTINRQERRYCRREYESIIVVTNIHGK